MKCGSIWTIVIALTTLATVTSLRAEDAADAAAVDAQTVDYEYEEYELEEGEEGETIVEDLASLEHDEYDSPEPWQLFGQSRRGFKLGGWTEFGVTANGQNPGSNFNGPVTFNDRDEFQFNQLWLFAEREADNGGCGWAFGGRADFVFGTDARFTTSRGLELTQDGDDRWNSGGSRQYGIALPQLYAEVAYNNLSMKVGHYFTNIGYEVVPAGGNFFYSRAYTMQYGEPFTHTGILFSYKPGGQWTFQAGMHYGWDAFDNVNNQGSLLAGATWTSRDERSTVAFAITAGEEDNGDGELHARNMYSIVATHEINDCWTYVLQHDAGVQENAGGGGADAEWYGINQYLFHTINDCWTAGLRMEWFRDDDGTRVTGLGVGNPFGSVGGNFYELTAGLNWKPHTNVTLRPELRWDWTDSTSTAPFADNTSDSQFTAAVDLIFLF